ncbi:hypothetical protein ACYF6T_02985 [Streptomyces sp. 7R007]
MGLLRRVLPPARAAARTAPGAGRPLLGAVLLRCLAPGWVLLRPPPVPRRLAWAEEAVAVHRAMADGDGLARALVLHAQALLLAERYEEACAAVDAAMAVPGARQSPAQRACALQVRAEALLGVGRADEALQAALRAEELYRAHPGPARRDLPLGSLPTALRVRGLALGALGRTEESVAVFEECAALLRAMTPRQAGRGALVGPRVFVELVAGLRALGRHEEALAVGPEAREAVAGPVVWAAPAYVRTLRVRLLTYLADCAGALGRHRQAREAAVEAVEEARRLSRTSPAQGARALALALYRLAATLRELDARHEELRTLEELTDLYARLAAEDPETYRPALADALDDLARCHKQAGRHRAAVAAGERSVAAYRLTTGREAELARTLANVSLRQQQAGYRAQAVASAREAVELTRRLAESDWETYTPLVARRLRVLAQALSDVDDHTAAVAACAEAETLLREQPGTAAELTATVAVLAGALEGAAVAHLDAGRPAEAVTALRSLLALTRRTAATGVHVTCLRAFADARARHRDAVVPAWQRATGEPYPTFVYTADRGRGSKPAAR